MNVFIKFVLMFSKDNIKKESNEPLYLQVANRIFDLIEQGKLKKGAIIPSVNAMVEYLEVSRVTVVNAYDYLKRRGIIESRHGVGNYIAKDRDIRTQRIFLLFDAMNGYKEVLYRSFINMLGKGYTIDVFFHYYNLKQFGRFIDNNLGDYNYYVVLPHFNEDVSYILEKIPKEQLILMDKDVPSLAGVSGVYQNFESDISLALSSGKYLLDKYNRLNLIVESEFQFIPDGIVQGFRSFCKEYNVNHEILHELTKKTIKKNEAYLAISDNDLISLVHHAKSNNWHLGRDIGIISYDDTPLKSVLSDGITVITTDFQHMGQMTAKIIKERIYTKIENPSRLIVRNSL